VIRFPPSVRSGHGTIIKLPAAIRIGPGRRLLVLPRYDGDDVAAR